MTVGGLLVIKRAKKFLVNRCFLEKKGRPTEVIQMY